MSFCCGGSMMGSRGTIIHFKTKVRNVPLLFCPICYRMEVHHMAENELEMFADLVQEQGEFEIDFQDYLMERDKELFENCVNHEDENPLDVIDHQIDMALDMMNVAKELGDDIWFCQLKNRLQVMSQRRIQFLKTS